MIPKKIHYCWFGKNKMPDRLIECINSWKNHLVEFEIKEWNENNTIKYQKNHFFKNALRKQQYAFASDYIRLQVLYDCGGVYLDTDMLVVKDFTTLLSYDFFIGKETEELISFGIIGSKPGHNLLYKMLKFYNENYFDEFKLPVITLMFNNIFDGLISDSKLAIFKPEYFYPFPLNGNILHFSDYITERSYAVHLWNHSWKEKKTSKLDIICKLYNILLDYLFYGYSFIYLKKSIKRVCRK
jgi:mannosyltransferase OCH1-like enzyme